MTNRCCVLLLLIHYPWQTVLIKSWHSCEFWLEYCQLIRISMETEIYVSSNISTYINNTIEQPSALSFSYLKSSALWHNVWFIERYSYICSLTEFMNDIGYLIFLHMSYFIHGSTLFPFKSSVVFFIKLKSWSTETLLISEFGIYDFEV